MLQVTSFQQIKDAVAAHGPVDGFVHVSGFRSTKTFYATASGRLMMHNGIDGTTRRIGASTPRLRRYIAAGALFLEP